MLKLILILFNFLLVCHANAQNILVSSIGKLNGANANSNSIIIANDANCLNVSSGIALFESKKNNGKFEMTCYVNYEFNTLGINFYPNPARIISTVKFIKQPPPDETFNLSIWSIQGNLLMLQKEIGHNLYNGIELNLYKLAPGSYILNIESARYFDTIKFIKTY